MDNATEAADAVLPNPIKGYIAVDGMTAYASTICYQQGQKLPSPEKLFQPDPNFSGKTPTVIIEGSGKKFGTSGPTRRALCIMTPIPEGSGPDEYSVTVVYLDDDGIPVERALQETSYIQHRLSAIESDDILRSKIGGDNALVYMYAPDVGSMDMAKLGVPLFSFEGGITRAIVAYPAPGAVNKDDPLATISTHVPR